MLVSILIPTYNEAADIRQTLKAAIAVRHSQKEILVVDDASTDNTISIVKDYADQGVSLIALPKNRGVAAARNIGLRHTQADIVIILNADVILPPDLIEKLLPIYEQGADFVVVEAQAINIENIFARYVQAAHDKDYKANPVQGNVDWSEGWSCRRAAALAIGGFPEELPGASGEDAIFVQRLIAQGYRRAYDDNIVVGHYVPPTLEEFGKQRRGRGRGAAYRRFGYEKIEPQLLPMLKSWLGMVMWVCSVVLPLRETIRLLRYSPRRWNDLFGMYWAVIVDTIGQQAGYWQGYREIVAKR